MAVSVISMISFYILVHITPQKCILKTIAKKESQFSEYYLSRCYMMY